MQVDYTASRIVSQHLVWFVSENSRKGSIFETASFNSSTKDEQARGDVSPLAGINIGGVFFFADVIENTRISSLQLNAQNSQYFEVSKYSSGNFR
jgi:hypothetical protein